MKSLLIAAALTGVSFASSAFAYNPQDQARSVTMPAPRPVLSSVVKPVDLPLNFSGALINIEFTLDQSGQPRDIRIPSISDPALKRQLVKAFRQWRFEPGVSDAAASQKRFILPLQVTPEA